MTGLDPALQAWADRQRETGDQPAPLFDVAAEPTRAAGPRVWPGGVEVVGPLLRIPGRTVHVDDLADAIEVLDGLADAVAELRREFRR